MVREWPLDSFDFEVNGAIILYFAVPFDNNPLPEEFKFTNEVVSVLKVNPKDKPVNNKLKAV